MAPDWLTSSGRMWWQAMTTMRGWVGLAGVSLLLGIAIHTTFGLPFAPPDLLVPGAHPRISGLAWALLGFIVLVYAPGQALEDHKKALGQVFYRWDVEPNIDRAYRVFDRLLVAGKGWRNGITEHRQAWDEEVRKALIEHCNAGCLELYLVNTGRATKVIPLPDARFEEAITHIETMLHRQLDIDIRWPR